MNALQIVIELHDGSFYRFDRPDFPCATWWHGTDAAWPGVYLVRTNTEPGGSLELFPLISISRVRVGPDSWE